MMTIELVDDGIEPNVKPVGQKFEIDIYHEDMPFLLELSVDIKYENQDITEQEDK